MANISRELAQIEKGRWGEEIRMPIHDALLMMANETPSPDPSHQDKYTYMITSESEYVITKEGDYVVAKEPNWFYMVTLDGVFVVASEDDNIIGLE